MKNIIAFALVLSLCSGMVSCKKNAFREQMAALDWGTDTCYVYGHKTPDADAVCSALAYAQLMRELGYNCEARVSGPANRETEYISGLFAFGLPAQKASVAPGTRLIATDHEEYIQCVDGARESRILQIIDHHQAGDMAAAGVPYIRREAVGSTCTIIWELYQEAKVPLDDTVAHILLAGILSDTDNLAKPNTVQADTLALQALAARLHIGSDSLAAVRTKMLDALSDYGGMSDYEIYVSDYKDYDMGGRAVGIGCVEWTDYAVMDGFIDRMLAVSPEVMARKGRTMVFLMATRYEADPVAPGKAVPTGTYILYSGEGAREAAELIFGQSIRDGVCYSENRLVRKRDVVPALTRIFQ